MTCACQTKAIDITLIVKMHKAMTNPICVSEAGTWNTRRNHAMVGLLLLQAMGSQMERDNLTQGK
jgi:hypothetical protein